MQYPAGTMTSSQSGDAPNTEPQQTLLQPDNVEGWAWVNQRGWFELPTGAILDEGGVRIWHHNSSSWMVVSPHGLEHVACDGQGPWASYDAGNYSKKDRDGDIPEWDGKSCHRTTYFRKIDLWEATTGVDPNKRGLRLLTKLTGEAFEKLEHVDPKSLVSEDSVQKFKKCVVDVYEHIEDYRVGKIMDTFWMTFVITRIRRSLTTI